MATACHYTHDLTVQRGIMWCTRCGAYTTRQPRALKDRCPTKPASAAAATILRRLRRGLNPTTAGYLERADLRASQTNNPYWHPQFSDSRPTTIPSTSQPSSSDKPHTVSLANASSHTAQSQSRDTGQACVTPRPQPTTFQRDDATASRYLELDRRRQLRQRSGSVEPPVQYYEAGGAPPTKRRLRGKQPPPNATSLQNQRATSGATAAEAAAQTRRDLCAPQAQRPWTTRIDIRRTAVARPCAICAQPCRGQCIGCMQALCIACARARRACVAKEATPSRLHDHHRHVDPHHPAADEAAAAAAHHFPRAATSDGGTVDVTSGRAAAAALSAQGSHRVFHHHPAAEGQHRPTAEAVAPVCHHPRSAIISDRITVAAPGEDAAVARGMHAQHHVDLRRPAAEAARHRLGYACSLHADHWTPAAVFNSARETTAGNGPAARAAYDAAAAMTSAEPRLSSAETFDTVAAGAFYLAQPADDVVVPAVDADVAPAVSSVSTVLRVLARADAHADGFDDGIPARQ